jgi:hypothetical protein
MIAAICAYLLGLQRWTPNHDRLMTMVEWQGGPQQSGQQQSGQQEGWIPLYKPITATYEPHHISNEIILFAMALLFTWWGWRNRHNKNDSIFARGVLALSAAGALYLVMLWLGRQHVEGDWTAVPPRLMKYEVDTPEFLAKEAAQKAEWEAFELKRTGRTAAQREAQWERMSSKGLTIFMLFTMVCAFAGAA